MLTFGRQRRGKHAILLDGKAVGSIFGEFGRDEREGDVERFTLFWIGLRAKHRDQGLGKQALQALHTRLKQEGITKLTVVLPTSRKILRMVLREFGRPVSVHWGTPDTVESLLAELREALPEDTPAWIEEVFKSGSAEPPDDFPAATLHFALVPTQPLLPMPIPAARSRS